MSNKNYSFKVILLGASGVGKTSIIKRYIEDVFDDSLLKPSLCFDFLAKEITRENKKIKLEIWDTAGQERFQSMAKMYYKDAHGVILAYDITDLTSFERMKEWLLEVEQNEHVLAKKIIVGTKSDLIEKRKIQKFDAKKFTTEKSLSYREDIDWIECSSRTGDGIKLLFDTLTDKLIKEYDTNAEFRKLNIRSTLIDVEKPKKNIYISNGGKSRHKSCCD